MNLRFYIIFIFLICYKTVCDAQVIGTDSTTFDVSQQKELSVKIDSFITLSKDTLDGFGDPNNISLDTLKLNIDPLTKIKISKSGLDDEVAYSARDSSYTDLVANKIHLYGNAEVNYQSINVKADSIVIDFKNNILEGYELVQPRSKNKEKPTFKESDKTFTFRSIRYNFKTKKGLVMNAITTEGEFNIVGETTKYIGATTDSLGIELDDEIYNKDAIITTCNHDPPHFGIRASKLKFVPNKVAVLSVAQLELGGVPTPLILPFGFFPLAKGKSSGILFPSYDYSDAQGFTLRGLGYYMPISNGVDLRLISNISTRGSLLLQSNFTYAKSYSYRGTATLSYNNQITERPSDGTKESLKSFGLQLTHNQDAKSHPYRNIGGSINIQTNGLDQRAFNDAQSVLASTYSSSFNFAHTMPSTPFQFTASFNHSQNTQTRQMEITLPNMALTSNTLFPFKKKNSTREVWTDNIAVSYNTDFRNFVRTADSSLFTQQTLDNLQTGLRQRGNLSTNFRVLKYLNVSPNASVEEYWFMKKYKRVFDPTKVKLDTITNDTLGFNAPREEFNRGFTTFRNINTSISINTQIFGVKKFNKGFVRGIRHVLKPNLNFNYAPANKMPYERTVDTDTRPLFNNPQTYSILENGPFGSLRGNEEQKSITFGLLNIFEAKYRTKKDTADRNIRLFDNININGGYNFAADSFQWSPITITGNTTVLKGLTNFNFGAMYSPYAYNSNDKITKQTVWDNRNRVLEFRSFRGQFTTSVTFARIKDILNPGAALKKQKQEEERKAKQKLAKEALGSNPFATEDEKSPTIIEDPISIWFDNFNISHNYNFEVRPINRRDTFVVTSHSINMSGNVPLTKNWTMSIGNIAYDIKNKSFVYPEFGFSRNLHCWQMNIRWAPNNGFYSFFIGVQSNAFSFLKYNYNQGFSGFR